MHMPRNGAGEKKKRVVNFKKNTATQVLPFKDFGGTLLHNMSQLQQTSSQAVFVSLPTSRPPARARSHHFPPPENSFSFQTEAGAPSPRSPPSPPGRGRAGRSARLQEAVRWPRSALRPAPPPEVRAGHGGDSGCWAPRPPAARPLITAIFTYFFGFRAFFFFFFNCDLLFFPSGPVAPCHEQPEGSMKAGRRAYPARSGVGWLLAKCCCCCSCKGRWGPGCRERVPPRGLGQAPAGRGLRGRSIPPFPLRRPPVLPRDERREGAGEGGEQPGSAPRSPLRREPQGPFPRGWAGEPAPGIGRERAKVDRMHFIVAGRKHPGTLRSIGRGEIFA